MADREQILRDQTFKDQFQTVEERIYFALTSDKASEPRRIARLLSLFIARAVDRGELAEENLDDLLFETVRG